MLCINSMIFNMGNINLDFDMDIKERSHIQQNESLIIAVGHYFHSI